MSKKFKDTEKLTKKNIFLSHFLSKLIEGNILLFEKMTTLTSKEEDVTKSLESAVRKMSRGSSPNHLSPEFYSGLSGLAKGYEQYRESLTFLRPTTEFGEPSSDDLSSEWDESSNESSSDSSAITKVVNLTETLATTLALNAVRRRKLDCNKLTTSKSQAQHNFSTTSEENNNEEETVNPAVESKKPYKRVSDRLKNRCFD